MDKILFPDHNLEDHDLLVRIDERVNKVLACLEKQNKRIDVLENIRVRSLERWKWMQVGVFVLLGLILGVVRFW